MRFGLLLCIVILNSIPEDLGLQGSSPVYKLLMCTPCSCTDHRTVNRVPGPPRERRETRDTRDGQQDSILIKLSNFIFYTRQYNGKQAGVSLSKGGKSLYSGNNLRGLTSFLRNSFSELSLRISGKNWHFCRNLAL